MDPSCLVLIVQADVGGVILQGDYRMMVSWKTKACSFIQESHITISDKCFF